MDNIELDIILIGISLAFLYGLSPVVYKIIIINNNISFDIYLILSSLLLLIFSLLFSIIFNKKINIINEIYKINGTTVVYFALYIFFYSIYFSITFLYSN